jgi:threonine 3-dehydrogenase
MRAIVKPRPIGDDAWPEGLTLEQIDEPQVEHPEDVKIRVVAAGICGTDVGIYRSRKALRATMSRAQSERVVIGHEFCGIPIDAGAHACLRIARILGHLATHDAVVGDYVKNRSPEQVSDDPALMSFVGENFYCSAEMHVTCGWCRQCRMGERHVCQYTRIKGVHEDGVFAEFVVVRAFNLVLFRRGEIPVDVIAFMDALGNAVHTVQEVNVTGKSVAVLGSGVQGLMATAVARHSGASEIYVTDFTPPSSPSFPSSTHDSDHIDQTLFKLARSFGANHCFDLAQPGARDALISAVMEETDGTGVDAVLEMSGNYSAYRNGLDIVRMGGTIGLLGLPEGEFGIDFARDVIFRGITIKGVIGRRVFETWEVMRNLLKSGLAEELLGAGFVSHHLDLEDYEKGMNAILNREAIKVILKP